MKMFIFLPCRANNVETVECNFILICTVDFLELKLLLFLLRCY